MTFEEIGLLQVSDVEEFLRSRVFNKKAPIIPDPLPDGFDYNNWYDSQISNEEVAAELVIYKSELTAIETDRLRRIDLETRFNGMADMRKAFNSIYPGVSNPAVFLRDLLNQEDHVDAESLMVALESKDVELETSPEKALKDFEASRIKEYKKEGATVNGILEALWEMVIEGDSTKADALQVKRQAVKLRVPKP